MHCKIFNKDLKTIASEVFNRLTIERTNKPELPRARAMGGDLESIFERGLRMVLMVWAEALRKNSGIQ